MTGIVARLRALFKRAAVEADVDEELAYHLERETERQIAAGLAPSDARDAARRSLGNLTVHAEQARAAYGWTWFEQARQDAAYGWRALRHSPTFTVVASLSLALGIGANTMIFGVTYSVLLEPLPVREPDRLVVLGRQTAHDGEWWFSPAEVSELRAVRSVVSVTATREIDNVPIGVGAARRFATMDLVDGAYYQTIGLHPLRGRTIDSADVATAASVAFVSRSFAERAFGSVEAALGKTVRVYDTPVSIIGVAEGRYRGVKYPGRFTIAVPVTLAPTLGLQDYLRSPEREIGAVARLAPGATRERAQAEMDAVFQRCCRHDDVERLTAAGMANGIAGGKDDAREDYAPLLYLLMAGAGVVLLIACANVGSLLLVRAWAREREIAVRMSLGASRARVIRQLLSESVVLAVIGGMLALPFAAWGTLGIERLIPSQMSVYADIVRWHFKPTLMVFTASVALICVMMFGVVPALRATRTTMTVALRTGGRGTIAGGRRLLDRGVVVAQLALALLLVSSASLLVSTLRNVSHVRTGFSTSGVTIVSIETRGTPFEQTGIVPLQDEMLRRVRAIPGVSRAGMTTLTPIAGGRHIEVGYDAGGATTGRTLTFIGITPGYLGAMGTPFVAGRDFTDRDDSTSEQVAIVSQALARTLPGGSTPIGTTLRIRRDSAAVVRIVGVAEDTRMFGLRDAPDLVVYRPVTQSGAWPFLGLAVRVPDGSEALIRRITDAVGAAAPGVRIRRVSTMRAEVRESMFVERMTASVATLFGSLALLLAAIGIYGVVAFTIARRTNEIGIRMALGAQSADVLRLVLRTVLGLVVVAVALGGPLTYVAGQALESQLYGVRAHDPVLLLCALGVLVLVALMATAVPASRAIRIDPLAALRSD